MLRDWSVAGCARDTGTHTYAHARAHAPAHSHMHTHAHTHTQARTHCRPAAPRPVQRGHSTERRMCVERVLDGNMVRRWASPRWQAACFAEPLRLCPDLRWSCSAHWLGRCGVVAPSMPMRNDGTLASQENGGQDAGGRNKGRPSRSAGPMCEPAMRTWRAVSLPTTVDGGVPRSQCDRAEFANTARPYATTGCKQRPTTRQCTLRPDAQCHSTYHTCRTLRIHAHAIGARGMLPLFPQSVLALKGSCLGC